MLLFELYQVMCVSTQVELFNLYGKNIFTGYLSELTPEILGTRVTRVDAVGYDRLYVSIDTTESEVKLWYLNQSYTPFTSEYS